MKIIFTAACAAAALVGCCCTGGGASTAATEAAAPAAVTAVVTSDSTAKQAPRCGGYTQQREPTAEELTLFKTAMATLDGVNYVPESVATQVVAGKNYRFVCKATPVVPNPQSFHAAVVIYQPLPGKGEPTITSIERL